MGLDLDPVGDVGVDLGERDRRLLAGDHGDDLGPLGEALDRRRQSRAGAAPGDDLAVGEADRVALAEAALGVVAGGRGDAAGGDPAQRRLEPLGVLRPPGASGSSSTSASRLACWEVARTTRAGFSESSQARSAAMITFEELGRTRTSSAGDLVDPGEQLVGRRVERLAAGDDVGAELGEEPLEALAGGDRDARRCGRPLSRALRSAICSRMSATSRLVTSPAPSNSATAASGSSVWTWTFSVTSSPTTRTESPRPSRRGRKLAAAEARCRRR